MSRAAIRAAGVVLLLGVLAVWLVRPIGDPCGDLGKLPPGSSASSKPSFTPPLTRSCTYTTPEGTNARKRYVPVVDWLALFVVAGVVGGVAAMRGPGGGERAPQVARAPRAERAPRRRFTDAAPADRVEEEHVCSAAERDAVQRERDAAQRERARSEREARRRGGA